MKEFLSIVDVENSIDRLGLPAFDPISFPITERRRRYTSIVANLANLYDCSIIDEYDYARLSRLAIHAYVHGGL